MRRRLRRKGRPFNLRAAGSRGAILAPRASNVHLVPPSAPCCSPQFVSRGRARIEIAGVAFWSLKTRFVTEVEGVRKGEGLGWGS